MKKQNNVTELVFILDRSGSMAGLEKDTVGGFNAMIEKQKKEEGECFVSTILFHHQSKVLHDRQTLSSVPPMNCDDYCVGGTTALMDALGDAIVHIANIHKYARKEDVPTKTLFVITTDGMENASRRYTAPRIREMIGYQKEKYGWEFLFIGANIDAEETAERYGIERPCAVNYCADSIGTNILYDSVSEAICHVRRKGTVAKNWSAKLDRDFNHRGK